ncbi:MAG: helix-turn-helix domain-containing protein [Bacteroidetes bacterium]|nr:helix-turn-helix domain-containing protein [Bacteroidota bacterium]MBU1371364.1 helix-turn-helix domain-containing protein [Bacteroidota bacterium]MBU1485852.1 helix-turn-helix domain-containing protein [Bacteroidota bacterium]MBU1762146.1 helix-turn-helix domain-containing protein [Bacteroidota bacterium]MBU2268133.1 helix-turn-helix domain-containing protein [Bacteroidota bacterium]
MENPFELILKKLDRIERLLSGYNEIADGTGIVLNVKQTAEYTNLSVSRIYKFTSLRLIPHYKNGKKLYFKKNDLDEWLTRTKVETKEDIEKKAINYIIKHPRKY